MHCNVSDKGQGQKDKNDTCCMQTFSIHCLFLASFWQFYFISEIEFSTTEDYHAF
jgi:hypothetical protein